MNRAQQRPVLPEPAPVFAGNAAPLFPDAPETWKAHLAEAHGDVEEIDPKISAHYHASAKLYKHWSPEGHLHFGYWRWPLNPFARKRLLEELVYQVADRLDPAAGMRLADLGCGYGTAARLVAQRYGCTVDAITAVEEQALEGTTAALVQGVADRVTMHHRDFRHTRLAADSLDGVYALESMDYGTGTAKEDVLAEAARILKPGARFAMAGGFLLNEPTGVRARMVRTTNEGWAIPCLAQRDAFVAAMERVGFTRIEVRDISWRMGPCALHGPLLMLWLEAKRLLTGGKLTVLERAHLRSCMLGIALGTQRDLFRYLMITAVKA